MIQKRRPGYFSLLATVLLVFACTLPTSAYAEEKNPSEGTVLFTEDIAFIVAENFASDFHPRETLQPSSSLAFCNTKGDTGYIINYNKGNNPYGYVIIDPSLDGLIAEYSIGSNTKSPYEVAMEKSGNVETRSLEDPVIVQVSPIEYGIVDTTLDTISTNSGAESDIVDIVGSENVTEAKNPATWGDATVDVVDVYRNYSITAAANLPIWTSVPQFRVIEISGRYACSVSAYFAISGYYGLVDTANDGQAYIDIWNYTGTTVDTNNLDTSAIWGSTPIDSGANGFVNYLASKGKYVTQYTTSGKPAFEEYVTSINNQDASVMHGWLYNSQGVMEGHTMFVEGYIRALSNDSWDSLRILQVFDGWYSGVRYINYDFANYAQFRGTFFVD